MAKRCNALYRKPTERSTYASVEIDAGAVTVQLPCGRLREIALEGCSFTLQDAACQGRFVRHIMLRGKSSVDFITPPNVGAIAPRVSQIPSVAKSQAVVIESGPFRALAVWLGGGGTLAAKNAEDLALIATIAVQQYAVLIGEQVAYALQRQTATGSPMRNGFVAQWGLAPLRMQARNNMSARVALLAALAAI